MTTFLNFCSIVQCTKNCLKTLPLGMNSNKDCPYITFITEEITSPCQSQILLRQILSNLRCQGLTLSTAKNVYLLKNCLMINNQLEMTAGGAVCVMWGGLCLVWERSGVACRALCCVSLTMRFHLFNDLMWTGFNETGAGSSLAAESPQLINGAAARDGHNTHHHNHTLLLILRHSHPEIQICKYQWRSVYLYLVYSLKLKWWESC